MASTIRVSKLALQDDSVIGFRVTCDNGAVGDFDINKVEYFFDRVESCNVQSHGKLLGYIKDGVYRTSLEQNAIELGSCRDIDIFIRDNLDTSGDILVENLLMCRYFICLNKVLAIGIPVGFIESVRVNSTFACWGRCACSRTNHFFRIEISERLLLNGSYEGIDNTVIHELLHTCPDCQKHTGMWKYYANLVNDAYGFNIKRLSGNDEKGMDDDDYTSSLPYVCQCDTCGTLVGRKSKSQFIVHPDWYKCKCGGSFIRIK